MSVYLKLDLWDLGEFNQKGTTRTKYGTIDELKTLATVAKEKDMCLYFDAVLNHKAAADSQQKCEGIQVDWNGIFHSGVIEK
jgi:alpha-amylase